MDPDRFPIRAMMLAAACLAFVACGPQATETPPDEPVQTEAPDPFAPGGLPPASSATPRYVGMWATEAANCQQFAWRFDVGAVDTPGEVHCEFNATRPTDTGYTIEAMCSAEEGPSPYAIDISFAESAQAMLVRGGPSTNQEQGLVYCGPLPPAE